MGWINATQGYGRLTTLFHWLIVLLFALQYSGGQFDATALEPHQHHQNRNANERGKKRGAVPKAIHQKLITRVGAAGRAMGRLDDG
jgi:cytochrome b561